MGRAPTARWARAFALALSLALQASAGCGGGGKGRGQGDATPPGDPALVAYQRALAPLAKLEDEALGAVAAQSGSQYQSDAQLAAALRDVAIPKYRDFVAGLAKLPPPPGERAKLHQRLQVLAAAELHALEALLDAVGRGDGNKVLEVNAEQRRLVAELDAVVAAWNGGPGSAPGPAPPGHPASAAGSGPQADSGP